MSTESTDAAARLLVACLGSGADADEAARAELLRATTPEALMDLATYHRVEGWVYAGTRSLADAPPSLIADLKARVSWAARRHLRAIWQLGRLASILDATGVPWVVVKGPVLADLLHGSGLRAYHDLDVLVEPGGFRTVLAAIEADGARILDRNWALLRRDMRGQVHLALEGEVELDLHWNLVNVYRRQMALNSGRVLARRVSVQLDALTVPTLDPADSIIHLAVHAALSGGDRLVWMKDIERAAAVRPPHWPDVVDRARAARVQLAVALIFQRTRMALGADIPAEAPRRLAGRGWDDLLARVDRWTPGTGGRSTVWGRLLPRVVGHGALDGSAVLVRLVLRHFDPRGRARTSPFTPAGDEDDRRAYLDAVVSSRDG